jgi:hypothetical protein
LLVIKTFHPQYSQFVESVNRPDDEAGHATYGTKSRPLVIARARIN